MTWRDVLRGLQNMGNSKLDSEALLYLPAAFYKDKGEIVAFSRFTTIDGDVAEEHDCTEGDPILLRY
jgi:hypothetical protein